MKYRVTANPKGGTCSQMVEANSREEAVQKAADNPDGWIVAKPRTGLKDWVLRAYER